MKWHGQWYCREANNGMIREIIFDLTIHHLAKFLQKLIHITSRSSNPVVRECVTNRRCM